MLSPAWPFKDPEATLASLPKELPEGEGKKLVAARCTACHGADRFMPFHMDRDHWVRTDAGMRANMRAANVRDLTDDEAKLAQDYLAANFKPSGPPDPTDRFPTTCLHGKALKYH